MPVSTENSISGPYTPNGVTTDFAFDFKATAASEVVALDQDGETISTALYSVTLDDDEGGTLSFSVAPVLADYSQIFIAGNPALTQPSDFDNAGPSFNPAALTRALDRAAARDLRQQREIDRGLKVAFGENAPSLPPLNDRKGKFLGFSSVDGSPVATEGSDTTIGPDLASPDDFKGGGLVALSHDAEYVAGTEGDRFQRQIFVTDAPFNAVGDGSTSDDIAIAAAVASALLTGRDLYWPEGDYLTTASIANFHDVKHVGPGRILRGSDTWYITPTGTQTNIIYVGSPNLNANDGLGSSEATNMATAFNRMRGIGDKAQDGQWRIQMLAGTITSTGITIPNMPTFRNRLQVWGADVALTAVPTSIWDGTSSAVNYAIRGDWSNNMCTAFFHFKNIKFINWDNAGLAGAIVIWAAGDVLSENIHTDNCSIGEWYRQCQARVTYGRCDNAATYGVAVQYGASGNIGNFSGGGKTFTNCAECINIGRNTTSYIQGCDLSGGKLIVVSRVSRIRPQGNTYRAWTDCVFDASNGGIITPDNGAGSPDTFIQTPTESTPVMKCASGSKHQSIHTYDANMHCFNDAASVATISGASGVQTLISTVAGVTGGDFVPARVPAWWAYSPTAQLTVELLATLNANAGGTLALHSQGSAASTKLAEIVIPAVATFRRAKITLEFINRPNSSTGRYECDFKTNLPNTTAGASGFSADASASLNSTATRDKLDSILNYRLYWTPADANSTTFSDMRSFIVV